MRVRVKPARGWKRTTPAAPPWGLCGSQGPAGRSWTRAWLGLGLGIGIGLGLGLGFGLGLGIGLGLG